MSLKNVSPPYPPQTIKLLPITQQLWPPRGAGGEPVAWIALQVNVSSASADTSDIANTYQERAHAHH